MSDWNRYPLTNGNVFFCPAESVEAIEERVDAEGNSAGVSFYISGTRHDTTLTADQVAETLGASLEPVEEPEPNKKTGRKAA